MDDKDSADDTRKPGFVSAIVLKFMDYASQNKGNQQDCLRNDLKLHTANKDNIKLLSNVGVRDKIKKFVDLTKGSNSETTSQSRKNSGTEKGINAEFTVFGDVSVKHRIKAFASLNNAVNSAASRPEVMKFSRFVSSYERNKKMDTLLKKRSTENISSFQKVPTEQLETFKESQIVDKNEVSADVASKMSGIGLTKAASNITCENPPAETTKSLETAQKSTLSKAPKNDEIENEHSASVTQNSFFSHSQLQEAQTSTASHETSDIIDHYILPTTSSMESSQFEGTHEDSDDDIDDFLQEFGMESTEEDLYNVFDPTKDSNYYPLPLSYNVKKDSNGMFMAVLPKCTNVSALKGSKPKSNVSIDFSTDKPGMIHTYSVDEYVRGDDSIDPLTASAEYEIEKRTELLDKFTIEITKDARGLGMSIVGIGLGSETGNEKLGIYIKALTPDGASEKTNQLKVHDQLLEVDGVSLVGVSQAFAAQTLKNTSKVVRFLIGREFQETPDENQDTT